MWKGVLRFAEARIPVRLYSAVQDRDIHFRLLHEKDRTPVRQQLVNPKTGDEVPYAKVRKAYEIEPGVFVILRPDELARLEPKDSRDIDVTRFVAAGKISHMILTRNFTSRAR
jgi:DNA end-binding protein Ku